MSGRVPYRDPEPEAALSIPAPPMSAPDVGRCSDEVLRLFADPVWVDPADGARSATVCTMAQELIAARVMLRAADALAEAVEGLDEENDLLEVRQPAKAAYARVLAALAAYRAAGGAG